MRYWIVDPQGIIAYKSGVHQLDIDALQQEIDYQLLQLPVDEEDPTIIPNSPAIIKAYPNPFNGQVNVNVNLPASDRVEVAVFDVTGRLVATLANETFAAGETQLSWTPSNLAAGVYLLRVQGIQTAPLTQKLVYVK